MCRITFASRCSIKSKNLMFRGIILITIFFLSTYTLIAQTASVLSSGTWQKLAVVKSGIYKIDYDYLSSNGIDPQTLDPRKVAIYGNGGGMLPQENSSPRINDLQEIAVSIKGEEDGIFNQDDYILFYAEGPHQLKYKAENQVFIEEENLYSDTTFYYLLLDKPTNGKRILSEPAAVISTDTVKSYTQLVSLETELYVMIRSGREWFGDLFTSLQSRSYQFDLPGLSANTGIKVNTKLMARSQVSTLFRLQANSILIDSVVFDFYGYRYFSALGEIEQKTTTIPSSLHNNATSLNLTLTYDGKGNIYSQGYFDAFDINYLKHLDVSSDSILHILNTNPEGDKLFQISGVVGEVDVWNVTNPETSTKLDITYESDKAYFPGTVAPEKQYVVFKGENFPAPVYRGFVVNQNLHDLVTPDFVIVTHPSLLAAAEELADFRRTNDDMTVAVATTEEVYNEFSSGKPDVTAIRDFVRHLYLKSTISDSLKYLLLFGDCSYNYKDKIPNNANLVPTYQSREGHDPLRTYASDDYFGFMDETEGTWLETKEGEDKVEIGIGRIPARNLEEALNYVNKIKEYHTSTKALGNWRSKITLVADDEDYNLHVNDSEKHAGFLEANYSQFNIQKIYNDFYDQILNETGHKISPEARAKVNTSINEGTLIFNYVGHGGWNNISSERLMNHETILNWKNGYQYPFFVTATCGFSLQDDPEKFSMGKRIILQKQSGAIGIVSGTRAAFSNANLKFNEAFFRSIFKENYRIGDVMRETKNNSLWDVYNRHVIMLSDPTLKLEYPSETTVIDSIAGSADHIGDTLQALKEYTVYGSVFDKAGVKKTGYNGTAEIVLFDKQDVITTKGDGNGTPIDILAREKILYRGISDIQNGIFNFSFKLPVEAGDSIGSTKLYVYSKPLTGVTDGHGAETSLHTGGVNPDAPADNIAPYVHAYIDSVTFNNGDTVRASPVLKASLSDENGLNISDNKYLISIINSDSTIILNKYFTPSTGDYTSGTLLFPFDSLPNGEYTLKISAWDNYNNLTETNLNFLINSSLLNTILNPVEKELFKLTAYPNPFRFETNIKIKLPENIALPAKAEIDIYTISGIPVASFTESIYINPEVSFNPDDHGISLSSGMYICQVTIHSPGSGKTMQSGTVIIKQ